MSTRFSADYAKRASNCKKCKQSIEKSGLRLAKIVPNPFSDKADEMKQYYHAVCLFETFKNARANTKVVESADEIENWSDLNQSDKDDLLKKIGDLEKKRASGKQGKQSTTLSKTSPKKVKIDPLGSSKQKKIDTLFEPDHANTSKSLDSSTSELLLPQSSDKNVGIRASTSDDSFEQFCFLCDRISAVSGYLQKTKVVKDFITKGSSGDKYRGDLYTLLKLLLPGVVKRVYNINSKQLVKLFSQVYNVDYNSMLDHFNSMGDIADTIASYFKKNKALLPCDSSTLSLYDVDKWLDEMTNFTKEDDQQRHLTKIAKKCTIKDLTYVIRLLKHDLRINAGAKHILEAVDPNAYAAFQSSRNLRHVIERLLTHKSSQSSDDAKEGLMVAMHLGIPCLPMLAEVCRSTSYAMKKCPNGMFAEIKYDGERVQIHKNDSTFHFFSRSLKPVQKHKIEFLERYIPQAFPKGQSLIIDSEVLLIDHETGKPLPFGTLGVHKKTAFKNANVCLFVFDCLYYQNESLMNKPLSERKKFLQDNMIPIKNHVMLSEATFIKHNDTKSLQKMIDRAISEGLEGLMIKDVDSIYEPGKRHWLKIKKDYLLEGSMADSADLIVLGAYYGTGNKGGMMSVFLMGCYDSSKQMFRTVTKCGNGHDDAALERINKELKNHVTKISKEYEKLPTWLDCNRQLTPDFVVRDPKAAPVWEISGAEFSMSDAHTADGISIRFPRVTKVRADKDWKTATSLEELKELYKKSKEKANFRDSNSEDSAIDSSLEQSTSLNKRKSDDKIVEVDSSHSKKMKMKDDLFEDMLIYFSEDVADKKNLARLITYFGGDATENKEDATHLILAEVKKVPRSKAVVASVEWLKDCIKKRELLPLKVT